MDLKTAVDIDEAPEIPDGLRRKIGRILRGAATLAIREQTSVGKFKQINKITFECESPKEKPVDSLDEIAEQCAIIMHACWLDHDGDEPIKFRLQIEGHPGSSASRARDYFTFTWDPEASQREGDDDAIRKTVAWEMYDQLSRVNDGLTAHIEELHTVIIQMATMTHAPLRAAGQQMDAASGMMDRNFTMLHHLMQQRFSTEAATAAEEGKTQRSKEMWDRLGGIAEGAAKLAGPQFVAWLKAKRGGTEPIPGAYQRKKPAQPQGAASESPDEADPDDDGDLDEDVEHPIAMLAEALGSMLDNRQRKGLREIVGDECYALFDEVFTAETDDEAVEIFEMLKTKLDLEQMVQLGEILSENQQEIFGEIMRQVDDHEPDASTDDDDASTEDDDE